MMTHLLDGKKIAKAIRNELKIEIANSSLRPPGLAFVLVGHDPASKTYVGMKKRGCEEVGIASTIHNLEGDIKESELVGLIHELNQNPLIDGILVQQPLPPHINLQNIIMAVDPNKDVDGFHPLNMGKVISGDPSGFVSCTPLGIQTLLKRSTIETAGKHVVIVGRSQIVGKPLAALLMQKGPMGDATVTVCHSKTHDLKTLCRSADILVAALGKAQAITKEMVKEGAIVIDVGINHLPSGQLVGDVDFDGVSPISSAITPVPGGVGPMTIAMLLCNTWKSLKLSAS